MSGRARWIARIRGRPSEEPWPSTSTTRRRRRCCRAAIAAYADALARRRQPVVDPQPGAERASACSRRPASRSPPTLGCDPIEVVFTGGGTEAINLAIKGLFWAQRRGNRILVPGGEHHATIDTVEWLERHEGAVVEWLPVDDARPRSTSTPSRQRSATDAASIALVSILWANNEVGTIQPVAEIAALAAAHGVPVHVDAVAAYGHVPIDFAACARLGPRPASGWSRSASRRTRSAGPVGIGALVLAARATRRAAASTAAASSARCAPARRMSPAAVAFAAAPEPCIPRWTRSRRASSALRDRLVAGVVAAVPAVVCQRGPGCRSRLPGNAHFTFPGCEGDSLLFLLDAAGVSVSTGSACQAGVPEASHVLLAMGRDDETAGAPCASRSGARRRRPTSTPSWRRCLRRTPRPRARASPDARPPSIAELPARVPAGRPSAESAARATAEPPDATARSVRVAIVRCGRGLRHGLSGRGTSAGGIRPASVS